MKLFVKLFEKKRGESLIQKDIFDQNENWEHFASTSFYNLFYTHIYSKHKMKLISIDDNGPILSEIKSYYAHILFHITKISKYCNKHKCFHYENKKERCIIFSYCVLHIIQLKIVIKCCHRLQLWWPAPQLFLDYQNISWNLDWKIITKRQ